jgi:hypothetical protein
MPRSWTIAVILLIAVLTCMMAALRFSHKVKEEALARRIRVTEPASLVFPFDGQYPKDWPKALRMPQGAFIAGSRTIEPIKVTEDRHCYSSPFVIVGSQMSVLGSIEKKLTTEGLQWKEQDLPDSTTHGKALIVSQCPAIPRGAFVYVAGDNEGLTLNQAQTSGCARHSRPVLI